MGIGHLLYVCHVSLQCQEQNDNINNVWACLLFLTLPFINFFSDSFWRSWTNCRKKENVDRVLKTVRKRKTA